MGLNLLIFIGITWNVLEFLLFVLLFYLNDSYLQSYLQLGVR